MIIQDKIEFILEVGCRKYMSLNLLSKFFGFRFAGAPQKMEFIFNGKSIQNFVS